MTDTVDLVVALLIVLLQLVRILWEHFSGPR
jgi:hypothetical protein